MNMFAKLNRTQRIVVGMTASTVLLLLLAHNPTSGYSTETELNYSYQEPYPVCNDGEKEKYKRFLTQLYQLDLAKDIREIANQTGGIAKTIENSVARCHRISETAQGEDTERTVYKTNVTELPFSEWTTNSPLNHWFGLVVNMSFLLVGVLIVGAIFVCYVFADKNEVNRT